jgi:hypothetical protein
MRMSSSVNVNDSLYSKGKTLMPLGPNGQKSPADVISAAVMIGKIATGEIQDTKNGKTGKTRSGIAGAVACAKSLSPEARSEIAKKAAAARWE